jgi:tRNA U34 5-methylaminomethyl-2-thiouridine-forming methyltransferase MnmC
MTAVEQGTAELDWRDGIVPVSTRFQDPYFSISDGLAETRHVFLSGNDLPARFRPGFHIAELGFGTGLNMLATLLSLTDDTPIHYTSFEAYPLPADDIARALDAFPHLPPTPPQGMCAARCPLRALPWNAAPDMAPNAT